MPRFNFTDITLRGRADITDVMDNFDKIEQNGITYAEVTSITNPLDARITDAQLSISSLNQNKQNNIPIGSNEPTSQTPGTIYIQYFENS